MGLFKERRPSLPAMNIKTEEVESDVVSLDREFVIKHQEPVGVDISVVMEDDSRYECLVRLQPCGDPSLYTIRLATNITTFPLKTSCTARSFSDWYYLDTVLRRHFAHCRLKPLPPRRQLWIENQKTKLEEIATFLLRLLSCKEILRSKVLQLFLQTQFGTNFIQENLEGKRNDLVSGVPKVETNTEPKVIHLNLPKISQNTYHGSSESYVSVKNLFNDNRKRSLAYISENFKNIKPERSLKSTMY